MMDARDGKILILVCPNHRQLEIPPCDQGGRVLRHPSMGEEVVYSGVEMYGTAWSESWFGGGNLPGGERIYKEYAHKMSIN